MSRIGLIAGNGRFPFLVLAGCARPGHDVTVVAIKEEAFPELEQAARDAQRRPSLGLARPPGQLHQDPEGGRRLAGGDGRAGQAREDLLGHRARPDAAVRPDAAEGAEHRRADLRGRRRDARRRHRAARFDRVPGAAAGARGRADRRGSRPTRSGRTSRSATGWPTRSPRSTSARRSRSSTRRSSRSRRWKAPTR